MMLKDMIMGSPTPNQKQPKPKQNPELAKAMINRERQRAAGSSFQSTIVGSGLKTSTGA